MRQTNKGTRAMEAAFLVAIAAVLLIAATFIYARKDEGSMSDVLTSVNAMKAEMKTFAKADELNGVREVATNAMGRTVTMQDACAQVMNEKLKPVTDDVSILKSRLDSFQLQKAKAEKTVIHKHEYSKPMQVDVNYPSQVMKPKGKGRGALLERSRN